MINSLKDLQNALKICKKMGITKADFKNLAFEMTLSSKKVQMDFEEEKPLPNPFAHDPSFYNDQSAAELDALLTQNEIV